MTPAVLEKFVPPPTDAALVARFAAGRDGEAFAELVRRHGPMVLAVCRRLTRHAHDADDAFQAVFLVLARKAGRLGPGDPVGGWLYGVAVRVARKAAAREWRRRGREALVEAVPDVPARTADPFESDAAAAVLDEVGRLPAFLRSAVVLCELQGRPRAAAARELGVAPGTLSSRLAAARRHLSARLAARGLAPAVLAVLAPAVVPSPLAAAAAARTSGSPPAGVAALARGAARAMVLHKFRAAPVAVALVAVVALAAGSAAPSDAPGPAGVPVRVAADPPRAKEQPPPRPAGPGRLLVTHAGRFEYRTPDGKADGIPPAHPVRALFGGGRVSPGGRWLAYTARPAIPTTAAELKTGPQVFVRGLTGERGLTAVAMDARHLCWAPGGSALVAAENRSDPTAFRYPAHWLIDPATGEKSALDLPPGYVHDWAPDGTGFLMSVADPDERKKSRLAVVGRDGRVGVTLLEMRRPCWPEVVRFSPDGRTVLAGVFADEESREWVKSLPRLHTIDVKSGAKREVPGVPLNAQVALMHLRRINTVRTIVSGHRAILAFPETRGLVRRQRSADFFHQVAQADPVELTGGPGRPALGVRTAIT